MLGRINLSGFTNINQCSKEVYLEKAQTDLLEKSYGGKAAQIGEVRIWSGVAYKKEQAGKWKRVGKHGGSNTKTDKAKDYLNGLLGEKSADITIVKNNSGDSIVKVNGQTAFNLDDRGMSSEANRTSALKRAFNNSKATPTKKPSEGVSIYSHKEGGMGLTVTDSKGEKKHFKLTKEEANSLHDEGKKREIINKYKYKSQSSTSKKVVVSTNKPVGATIENIGTGGKVTSTKDVSDNKISSKSVAKKIDKLFEDKFAGTDEEEEFVFNKKESGLSDSEWDHAIKNNIIDHDSDYGDGNYTMSEEGLRILELSDGGPANLENKNQSPTKDFEDTYSKEQAKVHAEGGIALTKTEEKIITKDVLDIAQSYLDNEDEPNEKGHFFDTEMAEWISPKSLLLSSIIEGGENEKKARKIIKENPEVVEKFKKKITSDFYGINN